MTAALDVVTRDNLHLSELTNSEHLAAVPFAIDCKNAFDRLVAGYVRAGVADTT
jgi:hypothetical protein